MKKTIFIYQSEACSDPFVYTSWEDAIEAVNEEINYYAEKWGDDDESIVEARQAFEKRLEEKDEGREWFGTCVVDEAFGFYVREVEFED